MSGADVEVGRGLADMAVNLYGIDSARRLLKSHHE